MHQNTFRSSNSRVPEENHRPYGLWLIFILIVLGLLFWRLKPNHPTQDPPPTPSSTPLSTEQLRQNLQILVTAHPELTIGVSFTELGSNAHTDIDGDVPFVGASTTKLITAINFMKKVEDGTYNMDIMLGDYPASFQLQQLINQSNNDSWDYFSSLLTMKEQESFAHSLGISSFKADTNSITPNDMVVLLQKLYSGNLLNEEDTKLILSYMQDTSEETILPPAIPSSATLYHKYGLLEGNMHDVAIIQQNGHTYFLAIYTNSEENLPDNDRKTIIQNLGKTIVDVVAKQK